MKSLSFSTIQEAERTIKEQSNQGFVLHVPIDSIHELAKSCPDNVILASTSGQYASNGYEESNITGFSYDLSLGEIVEIQNPPILSKEALEAAYVKVKSNPNACMLLLLDGLSGLEENVMTTFYFIDKNFKILGGSTGDNLRFDKTALYKGTKPIHHVALFLDLKTKSQIIKENIYIPHGEKLLITDADPITRTVYRINNQPATTEYARLLDVHESKLTEYFMNHPLGKIYEDEILIASPMKVNPDKSITFYSQVMPNTFVYLLTPANPVDEIKKTMQSLDFKPSFMYVVNCILRSLKFQEEGLWPEIDQGVLKMCKNTTGFVSYGEQFYKHHINQTMVILAVE